jgi:WD40 repeat protein
VAFAPDGRSIVSAGVDKAVLAWTFRSDDDNSLSSGHGREVTALAASADGRVLASAAKDGTVRLWDAATGAEQRVLSGHSAAVSIVAVAPDGKQVLSVGDDRQLKAWDAATGREVQALDAKEDVLLMLYAPDCKHFYTWTRRQGPSEDDVTHSVQQYDAATLKPGEALQDRGRRVSCLAFSADGALIAMGAHDGSVRIWDFVKKERVGGDRPAHAKALWDLAITPDKKTLVTGDKEGEIKVWDLPRNQLIHTMKAAAPSLYGMVVSSDSTRLATFSDDGRVELWDLAAGKSLRRWELRVGVHALTFAADGKSLVTGNDNGTIYSLDLP